MKNIKYMFPALRNKFGGKRLIYFDNACTVLKPEPVIRAVSSYYERFGGCSGSRSSHYLSLRTQELIDEARDAVKNFLNAKSSEEIVWTKNATEGINLVAGSFPFRKDKNEIIVSLSEHHSNILPFYEQSRRRGFKLKVIPVQDDGTVSLDFLRKNITHKTALIAISHLSNVTGLVFPVEKVISLAHSKGARVLVDDAQYIAAHREDVRRSDVDFLVFSGHKIGSFTGIGVLYGKEELLKKMLPYNVGGGTVRSVTMSQGNLAVSYLPVPARFEAGIQNYGGIISLKAAIDFLLRVDQAQIQERTEELTSYAFDRINMLKKVDFLGDYKTHRPSSLFSFRFASKKTSLYDFNIYLNHNVKKYRIAVRCGHHCAQPLHAFFKSKVSMRLSFFVYNTKREVDIFIKAFRDFVR